MRKAVSTLACDGWTLEKSLDVLKRNSIQAMEIRMGIHEWSRESKPLAEYKAICGLISDYGITVSNLGTGIVIASYREEEFSQLRICARIAQVLRCRGLRIMLGYFRERWSETLPEPDHAGIVSWLSEADRIMAEYGTEIWIETHNEYATAQSLVSLCEESSVHHCRLIWDIMHPLEAGEAPEETLALMGDRLAHVHIKDGMPWDDEDMVSYRYTKIGEGTVPVKKIVGMLEERGYEGYCSLEWEGIWRKELSGYEPERMIEAYGRYI